MKYLGNNKIKVLAFFCFLACLVFAFFFFFYLDAVDDHRKLR